MVEYDSSDFILRKEIAAGLLGGLCGGLCGGAGSTGSCGRIIVYFGFGFNYFTGNGIDHIIIFDVAGFEIDFVDPDSVLIVKLDFKFADVVCVDSCMVEYDSSDFILRKELAAGLLGGLCGGAGSTGSSFRIIIQFGLEFDYFTCNSIDLIFVFGISDCEFDLIDPDAVIKIEAYFVPAELI